MPDPTFLVAPSSPSTCPSETGPARAQWSEAAPGTTSFEQTFQSLKDTSGKSKQQSHSHGGEAKHVAPQTTAEEQATSMASPSEASVVSEPKKPEQPDLTTTPAEWAAMGLMLPVVVLPIGSPLPAGQGAIQIDLPLAESESEMVSELPVLTAPSVLAQSVGTQVAAPSAWTLASIPGEAFPGREFATTAPIHGVTVPELPLSDASGAVKMGANAGHVGDRVQPGQAFLGREQAEAATGPSRIPPATPVEIQPMSVSSASLEKSELPAGAEASLSTEINPEASHQLRAEAMAGRSAWLMENALPTAELRTPEEKSALGIEQISNIPGLAVGAREKQPESAELFSSAGMAGAKFTQQMVKTEDKGPVRASAKQTLPEPATTGSASADTSALRPVLPNPVKPVGQGAEPFLAFDSAAVSPRSTLPMGEELVRETRNAEPADGFLHELQSELTQAVFHLKRLRTDSMSVVLRPDAHTELELQLNVRGGVVDVDAHFKRGSADVLQGQWEQLQQSMSQQGVRVGPLQETSAGQSSSGHGSHPFRERPASREELVPEPARPGTPMASRGNPGQAMPTPRPRNDQLWESWA